MRISDWSSDVCSSDLFAGLAFVPLAYAAERVGASGAMASVWWLVLAYFILEVGEMCLSPVGLSAVTQLSVARVTSLMMGTWFLATAFSETLAQQFAKHIGRASCRDRVCQYV